MPPSGLRTWEPVLIIKDLTNSELTWEKLKEFNVGVDFALKKPISGARWIITCAMRWTLSARCKPVALAARALRLEILPIWKPRVFEVFLSSTNLRRLWLFPGGRILIWVHQGQDHETGLPSHAWWMPSAKVARPCWVAQAWLYSTRFAGLSRVGIPEFYNGKGEIATEFGFAKPEALPRSPRLQWPRGAAGAGGLTNTFTYKNFRLAFALLQIRL